MPKVIYKQQGDGTWYCEAEANESLSQEIAPRLDQFVCAALEGLLSRGRDPSFVPREAVSVAVETLAVLDERLKSLAQAWPQERDGEPGKTGRDCPLDDEY